MTTIAAILSRARARLRSLGYLQEQEAEILLAHVLNKDRSYLYAHSDEPLSPPLAARYERVLQRRCDGTPVAYITGTREFYGLPLNVNPAVLVPRPETELLVDIALQLIPQDQAWHIADLGTGSGAIALAIAKHRPRCYLYACDRSHGALAVAQRNAAALGLTNLSFLAGDWLAPLPSALPMIVSNPPYVHAADARLNDDSLRHEPLIALTPGDDGLGAIKCIIEQATKHLFNNGWLILEHGYDQGTQVRDLMRHNGYHAVTTEIDLSGIERVTRGRWQISAQSD